MVSNIFKRTGLHSRRSNGRRRGCLALGLSLLALASASAQNVVQTFFVPFEEDEVNLTFNTIADFNGSIGNTTRSTISIVGGITNTVVYWDHWEDGYEALLTAPTQSTTQVWGDNNPLNGIPPNFVNDRVNEGSIITLINDIPAPRNPTNIYFDARDKMSVSRWVAMARYLYAPDPGEVLADSAQVYDRSKYGFFFRAPVGINTGTNQMFEFSALHVMAGYNDTVVRVDTDGDGNYDETVFLDEGENHVSRFTFEGARVLASKPVQAHLITGDIGSNYELRFFELFPESLWDNNYYTSAHTVNARSDGSTIPTEVYLFNPNTQSISVVCQTLRSTSTVTVAANTASTFLMPTNTGANVFTTNGMPFIPVSVSDARQPSNENQAYDWASALVPVRALTTVAIVPWAPGAGGNPMQSDNGSPVWVTGETNFTLYVDLDGNPSTGPLTDSYGRRYNFSTNLVRLQSVRLFDTNDNDQTGMRLYTTNDARFTAMWGQDPSRASPGNPYLDMGAAVFPFPTVPAVKEWALAEDLNTNGVVNPGDSIRFTIFVVNVSYADAYNVMLLDTGASNTTYTLNSSYLNGSLISDDSVPPAITEFPFDENGYNIGLVSVGTTATVSYVVTINDPFPTNVDGIVNGVYVDNRTQVFVPVPIPGFTMTKTSPTNLFNPGDTISYTIDITSTANVHQSGVQVIDQLPATLTYVPNSARAVINGEYTGNLLDRFLVAGEYNGQDGALIWNGDWQEIGEANGASAGSIQVLTDSDAPGEINMLRVQGSDSAINIGAMRRADLRRFTNATLRFDYRRDSMDAASEIVSVAVSSNGGSAWTVLTNLTGAGTDAGYISVSNLSLNAFRSTNFALRFLANTTMTSGDRVWIDNAEIIASGYNITNTIGGPPQLIANYGLGTGQTMRITFDATINADISVSQIVNRAFINSLAAPSPLEAGVTNWVLLPNRSRIGGWVRNDLNGDGNVTNLSYPGIPSVALTLYTDPNRDGNPSDGAVVASAYTDTNGFFDLGYFLSNGYVVVQTDLVNWRSTTDSDGGPSNRIALTTYSGVNFTNNVFLDTRLAIISGEVRYDADADGDVGDADAGIGGVTVTLYSDPNGDGNPADGSAVSSRVTDVNGVFVFDRVGTGNWVAVEADSPGMISTGDSTPPNDNRVAAYLPGGLDSFNHVFLDTSSGLDITKTASPPGIWFPTLRARYVISVVNTGIYTHTGLAIDDTLGEGLSYQPGSAVITHIFQTNVYSAASVRDDFNSASYSLNTGTTNWLGSWVEVNETTSPSSGSALINNGRLRMSNTNNILPGAYREADLSRAVWATLRFRYEASNNLESAESAMVEVSTNQGSSYTVLTNITGISGARSETSEFNLLPYAATNTRVRFRIDDEYRSADEFFRVDWVEIQMTNAWPVVATNILAGDPPSGMATNYRLGPGDSISVVFTAQVASSVSGVTNTACVTSSVLTNGLCDTVINSVDPEATPDRISGQVRYDSDGDGDMGDPDAGIQGVQLTLYTDPNADGNPSDGAAIDATVSDYEGYYIFGDLSSGDYVVVETDLSGYVSTADMQPPNDNRIPVNLPGGVDSRDNDFLDWTLSGLTIRKTSSADYIVVPGESMTYSIIVSNTRSTTATDIRVVDPLPPGITFVPSSCWVNVDGIYVSNSVRDLFNAAAYTNDDGSRAWNGNWVETGDSPNGYATSGNARVITDLSALRLRLASLNRSVKRSADISGGGEVTLSYFFRRSSLENGEYAQVFISTNGTAWDLLETHGWTNGGASSQSDTSYRYFSADITAYTSTNTYVRFSSATNGNMGSSDFVFFDDINFDFGLSGSGSWTGAPPPTLLSGQTLSAGGTITITFTSSVGFADAIVNTAAVYTASDTNGLKAVASNLVGIISMTQGLAVAQSGDKGVRVAWSAYTNQEGEVSREYDVLYVDDINTGFHAGLTSGWACVTTVYDGVFSDFGGPQRPSPTNMGNAMRFYRASFKNTWGMSKNPRYATREIYVAKAVDLKEGENFLSLFMIPDQNRAAWVFGTNLLPAGSTMANSTRIEWYASTAASEATNIIWLSNAGIWQYASGGNADNMPLPLHKGFNLIIPPGAGDQRFVLVGKVPTNASAENGHSAQIAGGEKYNIVSYNVPYRVRLIDSGLKEAGFKGVSPGRPFNPRESDEIRILQRGGGSLATPIYRILMNSSGQFQFWTGGSGVADNLVLEPDYALVIYTIKSTSNWTWNVSLPYPAPTMYMSP